MVKLPSLVLPVLIDFKNLLVQASLFSMWSHFSTWCYTFRTSVSCGIHFQLIGATESLVVHGFSIHFRPIFRGASGVVVIRVRSAILKRYSFIPSSDTALNISIKLFCDKQLSRPLLIFSLILWFDSSLYYGSVWENWRSSASALISKRKETIRNTSSIVITWCTW